MIIEKDTIGGLRKKFLHRLRPIPIRDWEFENTGPCSAFCTILKLIRNTFAKTLHSVEGCVLFSTFVLILLWGTHGKLDIPHFVIQTVFLTLFVTKILALVSIWLLILLCGTQSWLGILLAWVVGWKGPGSDPGCRAELIPIIPWDHEAISWVVGFVLLVVVPALLIKVVYPSHREGSRLRDYGLWCPPRNRRRFAWFSATVLFLFSLPTIYMGIRSGQFENVYPLYQGEFSGYVQFALYELCYFMFFVVIEFTFRGYLLFGALRARQGGRAAGVAPISGLPPYGYYALLISMLSYTAWHLGKPPLEMISTLIWGVAAGVVVLVSRSVWPVIIVHWLLNVVLDLVLWKQWFIESLLRRMN